MEWVLQKGEAVDACSDLGAGLANGSTTSARWRTGDWLSDVLDDVLGEDEGEEEVDAEEETEAEAEAKAEASADEKVEEEEPARDEAEEDEDVEEGRKDEEVDSAEAPEYDATPVAKWGELAEDGVDVVGVVADE